MDAGVAQSVLTLTLVIIGGLGGVGVTDEFGIEVQWMIRFAERKPEIVDGEHVFKQL